MKNKHSLLILLLFFSLQSFTPKDKAIKSSFNVSGMCMMCKEKIESTATNIEGVKSATWNVQKQNLKVKFFSQKTSLEEIQKSIALIGYDTELFKATNKAYNDLHYCCKYERK